MPDTEWPSYSESTGALEVATFFVELERRESGYSAVGNWRADSFFVVNKSESPPCCA